MVIVTQNLTGSIFPLGAIIHSNQAACVTPMTTDEENIMNKLGIIALGLSGIGMCQQRSQWSIEDTWMGEK